MQRIESNNFNAISQMFIFSKTCKKKVDQVVGSRATGSVSMSLSFLGGYRCFVSDLE